MQERSKLYMNSYMASNGSRFMVTWIVYKKPHLGGRCNTRPRDHGTPKYHSRCFILFHHARGPRMNRNALKWHLNEHLVTYGAVTTRHGSRGVLGRPLKILFWVVSCYNFMVSALGSRLVCEVALLMVV